MAILDSFITLQNTYKQTTVANTFNRRLINCIENKTNKVMYGFRYTVGTELKKSNVNIDKISEILDYHYKNTSMTKEVYKNGYSLVQLKEDIEKL